MRKYRATWTIDVNADSPEEARRLVMEQFDQSRPDDDEFAVWPVGNDWTLTSQGYVRGCARVESELSGWWIAITFADGVERAVLGPYDTAEQAMAAVPANVRAPDAARPKVHVLRHGLPLCEFSLAEPEDWPEGHKWIEEAWDAERQAWVISGATCNACRQIAKNEP